MNAQDMVIEFVRFGIIPWCIWVTASIFNQRQQIMLLKQEIELLREIKKLVQGANGYGS